MTQLLQTLRTGERVKSSVTSLAAVMMGALCIALGSQFRVRVPLSPVPITAQTLAVMLVAAALGARKGAFSTGLYLLGGFAGLPWFAAGALFGPTGGYLVGFVAAAGIIGALLHSTSLKLASNEGLNVVLVLLLGHVVIYTFGLSWLSRFVGADHVLTSGLLPFLPGDLLKLVCATSIIQLMRRQS